LATSVESTDEGSPATRARSELSSDAATAQWPAWTAADTRSSWAFSEPA
jgi:hypothetical protein